MNKSALIRTLAEGVGIANSQAERVLELLASTVGSQVNSGTDIVVPGLGKFSRKHRAARTGRNPQTGNAQENPAKNTIVFKPGKEMRDRIEQPTA